MKNKSALTLVLMLWAAPLAGSGSRDSYNHFTKALLLERRGKFEEAFGEYKKTLLLDPDAEAAYRDAINLAFRLGKLDYAGKWSEYIVAKDSSSAKNWILRGNYFWLKGENEKAEGAFRKALEIEPDNPEAVYQLAGVYSTENPEKSIKYFKKYLELMPENKADVYYKIGTLYSLKGDYGKMTEYLRKAAAEDPYYLPPRYMLAEYYELRKDTQAAIGEYLEIYKVNPNDRKLLDYLGNYYLTLGKTEKAEELFLKSYAIDNSDPDACFWLAVISEKRGDFESAARYLSSSSALGKNPKETLQLAYYYTQINRYPDAIKLLEKARKKWPDNSEIGYFLALGYMDMGEKKKAFSTLKELAAGNPGDSNIYVQLGIAAESVNDIGEMQKAFKKALEINPKNDMALNYWGYSLADRGIELEKARGLIEKALEIRPRSSAYLDSMGWVYFRMGDVKRALEYLKKSVSLLKKGADRGDAVIWEHLGDILEKSGKSGEAWKAWKISQFMSRKKKLDEKLARARKKFGGGEFAEALGSFLLEYSSFFKKVSAFCSVRIRAGGKKLPLDGLLIYDRGKGIKFKALSPMMSPLWEGEYVFSEGFRSDELNAPVKINPENFKSWFAALLEKFYYYYSGMAFMLPSDGVKKSGNCLEGGSEEICFNAGFSRPRKIRYGNEKITMEFPRFFGGEMFFLPKEALIRIPGAKISVIFREPKVKTENMYYFSYPDDEKKGKN